MLGWFQDCICLDLSIIILCITHVMLAFALFACIQSSEEDEIDSTEVKKYDAAVFDMIKVQPEEFAVSVS